LNFLYIKKVGQGTGLVASVRGRGTTFRI
jgi:hypothetical protein